MRQNRKYLELLLNLVFWLFLLALSFSMARMILPGRMAFWISLTRNGILAAVAYIHVFLLIPQFFIKKKYLTYCFSVLVLFAFTVLLLSRLMELTWVNEWVDSSEIEGPLGKGDIPPLSRLAQAPPLFRLMPQLFLTFTIFLLSSGYALGKGYIQKERQASRLQQEKIKHELNFLRGQINPHFLFNALNNLQAKLVIDPASVEEHVLKLGEMLRYILEDCKAEQVSLEKEIAYIRNYIFFQQQKDKESGELSFEVGGLPAGSFFIEPMVLISLVENAFQHSYLDDPKRRFIHLRICLKKDRFEFFIQNNLGKNPQEGINHGIGLSNIQRRLELRYPHSHQLQMGIDADTFHAELTINREKE